MKLRKIYKKGDLSDIASSIVQTVVIIIGLLVILFIALQLRTGFMENPEVQANDGALNVIDKIGAFPAMFDWGFAFVFFGLVLGSLAYFFFAEKELFLMIVSWFILILFSIMTLVIGYVLQTFTSNAMFIELLSVMKFTALFIDNFFLFATLYFFISLLALHIPR